MYRSCAKCGKVHKVGFPCPADKRIYATTAERKLRSTYKWTIKSKEVRDKAHYLCEVCADQGVINFNDIEVHHIVKVKDDTTLFLENDNLICLCTHHHHQADEGKFDIEYLRQLAIKRESRG